MKKPSKSARSKNGADSTELRPLRIPTVQEARTHGGVRVLAVERGPLPLVSIRLFFESGSATDPAGKHGLADVTVQLLRRGTRRLTAEQISERIEYVGGSLGAAASEDYSSLGISAPAEHFEAMLEMLGEIVREPAFPEEEVASARGRTLAQLSSLLDDPAAIADRGVLRALWGEHPYGHDVAGTRADVSSFTRADHVAFHQERLGPRVATLVVVGAVKAKRVFEAAEKAFEGFTGGPQGPLVIPPRAHPAMAGKVVLIDKPDQTQTQLRVGAMGIAKSNPDRFAITAFNTALGGGFTSRLITQIRVKRGLSYGANSSFDAMKAGGTFVASTFTQTQSTRKALDVVLKELARMRDRGPTPAELQTAKRFVCGLYPARFETNEGLSGMLGEQAIYELPKEWLERYRERLVEVSTSQAAAAARAHLPGPSAIVLVGKASEVRPQLSGLGEITELEASELA